MEPVNDALYDSAVRHQVRLQLYSKGLSARLIKIIEASQSDILGRISASKAMDAGSLKSRRFLDLLDALNEINRQAYVAFGAGLRKDLWGLSRLEVKAHIGALSDALPVDFDFVTPPAELLRSIVTSRPLQGRYLRGWVASLDTASRRAITDAIRLGMVQGESTEQIIRRLRGTREAKYRDGVYQTSRRQAQAIVRTSVNHVSNNARTAVYEANQDVIKGVRYTATLDSRTTPICRALDGKVYRVGKGPRPPQHMNCRSVAVPITRSWRELGIDLDEAPPGTRASMNGQVPSDLTYEQWLRNQSPDFQDDVLGKTRGRLFRDGGYTVERFVDTRGRPYTLDELREKSSAAFRRAGIVSIETVGDLEKVGQLEAERRVRALISGVDFDRFYGRKETDDFPVAVLPDFVREAIGAQGRIAVLSPYTLAKQWQEHPDIGIEHYRLLPQSHDRQIYYHDIKRKNHVLIYFQDKDKWFRAVFKATAEALFLLSMSRIRESQALKAQKKYVVLDEK